ncbi:MAG: serine/threonine protein kinase [Gemmatimonadales bacterium]|nr:serine/threonine protein kinase [Gemmatimonadales bacterium]
MDPARWERLEQICFAALDHEPDARPAFVERACEGDLTLAREALDLLHQLERDPAFLETPVVDLNPLAPATDEPRMPDAIGPYRLVRRIGRGGMGDVFLATRVVEDIEQRVALKLIRRGMDTDEVLGRFRLERRILASLHHPNIASLLDAAATDDGRPYFVMEFVEGLPLTEYCDLHRLGVAERLGLFLTICDAVQHAHQNLVVHRDLKPSNILVTEAGIPKLLDFGIGKVLAPTEALSPGVETRTDVRLLTPEYAAPEQVAGRPVTTATDVYGLGLLLYQLLTGRHPYLAGGESISEIERAVADLEPERPSSAVTRPARAERTPAEPSPAAIGEHRRTDPLRLRRLLSGDLDTIVLKALRKEPGRRYLSAAALGDDIKRHLDGLPVAARPDTFGYRARKFVRRNAGAVAVTATAFLALATTTVVTMVQSARVARESARAVRERDKAVEVRGFLMEMFGATGANQAVGDTVTARRLLDLQVARLPEAYPDRPDLEAEMTEVLADGYDRLGLYREAEPLARRALELRRAAVGPNHPDAAGALNLLGWILHERGQSREAAPLLEEAVAVRRTAGPAARADLSRSLNDLGVIYNALNRYPAAEAVLREALAIRRETLGDGHRAVGITANNLAAAHYLQGHLDSAVAIQDLALQALHRAVGPDHQRTVVALGNLATFRRALGDWREAEAAYRELLVRQSRIQGRDHPVTARVMISLAIVLAERGGQEGDAPVLAEAESLFREAKAALEARLGPAHPQVGTVLERLAGVVSDRGAPAEAAPMAERALAIIEAGAGDSSQAYASAVARLASIRRRLGQTDAALALQRQAVATFERAVGKDHLETARARGTLCDLLLFQGGDPAEARDLCGAAEATIRAGPAGYHRLLPWLRLRLAQANRRAGQTATADSLLALLRSGPPLVPALRPALDSLLGGPR